MIDEALPIREKLIKLQKERKIVPESFTYGFDTREPNQSYVNVAFEVQATREKVYRTLRGATMQEAADKTMELLGQVK